MESAMQANEAMIEASGRFTVERFNGRGLPKSLSDAANSFQAALDELHAAEMELEKQIVDLRVYINAASVSPSPNLAV
jgi:hypothetical protein